MTVVQFHKSNAQFTISIISSIQYSKFTLKDLNNGEFTNPLRLAKQ